jgi:N-acyl-D-amino-acid deacylase
MRDHLLIRGARIIDGTGAPSYLGDLAVRGDRISSLAPAGSGPREADRVIEANGLALSPGFIDVHSHDDSAVVLDPDMAFKVTQGVTTEIVGNCGFGPAPHRLAAGFASNLYPGRTLPPWEGHAGYLARIDAEPPSLNVGALVGHGSVRAAAMGPKAKRPPTEDELEAMRDLIREGVDAGAVGLSSGLIYEPGLHADTAELVTLSRVLASAGALYATHMRDESLRLLDSVSEAIRIGEEAGVAVQISHLKASGKLAFGLVRDALELIEAARGRGVDVTSDLYPYTAASTLLAAVVGGLTGEADEGRLMAPKDVVLASCPHAPELEGKSFAELEQERGVPAADVARELLSVGGGKVWVVMHLMADEDVDTVMRHPTTMIGSDGIPTAAGKPHPRLYGTFPRVLGRYSRERGLLGLEEAVHRMTGFPTAKFGLGRRGILREGWQADLVLFDPATIGDAATYADPHRISRGITEVFVNGTTVVRDGRHTGARPGRAVRRSVEVPRPAPTSGSEVRSRPAS